MRESCSLVPGRSPRVLPWVLGLLLASFSGGCAALTNPTADGVPARLVPPEFLAPSREGVITVPLHQLLQPRADAYRVAPGDVLGIYIGSFLGDENRPIPLHIAAGQPVTNANAPPSLGYPVPVQADGSIALPRVGAVPVHGKTLPEVRGAILEAYLDKKLLTEENARVLVSLIRPRLYQVLVFRQEGSNFTNGPTGFVSGHKRGTSSVVDLPAYQNDLGHALARTGGLPGLDAYNEAVIFRAAGHPALSWPGLNGPWGEVTRIPLRWHLGRPLPFGPEDVILGPGDVVFLEARDREVFYTGGLLPPGRYPLPRDQDLDVLQAVATVQGPLVNGAFGLSNLSGTLIQGGLGNPSPSLVTVLRRLPDGRQLSIVVDLRRALRDPRERLILSAGDVVLLQETPGQALARYFSTSLFNFNIVWELFREQSGLGVVDIASPDRLPGRLNPFRIDENR